MTSFGGGPAAGFRAAARFGGTPVHSSISRWAFTPPKPKPLTAARRGSSGARRFHRSGRVSTLNGPSAYRSPAAGSAKFACGGSVSAFIASSTFVSAAAPAPVSRWPTVDFTEPIVHCPGDHPDSPHSSRRLSNSTASPTGVPVAWHSINSASCGFHPARAYAARIARN